MVGLDVEAMVSRSKDTHVEVSVKHLFCPLKTSNGVGSKDKVIDMNSQKDARKDDPIIGAPSVNIVLN